MVEVIVGLLFLLCSVQLANLNQQKSLQECVRESSLIEVSSHACGILVESTIIVSSTLLLVSDSSATQTAGCQGMRSCLIEAPRILTCRFSVHNSCKMDLSISGF